MAARRTDLESGNVAGSETDPLIPKGVDKQSQSVAKPKVSAFRQHIYRAARITTAVLILSLPIILPRGSVPYISTLVDNQYLTAITLQYVYYIVQPTCGATLRQWLNCFIGLGLAAITVSALELMFPGGCQQEGDMAAWTAMVLGCLYMIAVPMLNFPLVTVVFACSRMAIWWMEFSNPNLHMYGSLKKELSSCLIGGLAAVMSTLLPSMVLSRDKAPELCIELASTLKNSWRHFNEYYCGSERNTIEVSRLRADLANVYGQLSQLETHIQDSWWECALSETHSHARVMMHRQLEVIHEAYTRLLDVLNICLKEDFGASHVHLVKQIKATIHSCTETACELLGLCAQYSCDGDIDAPEQKHLQELIEKLHVHDKLLAEQYHAAKIATISQFDSSRTPREADAKIIPLLMDEDAYTFEVTGFLRMIREDARDLLAHQKHVNGEQGGQALKAPPGALTGSMLAVWKSKITPEQQEFALKTAMSIILAFLLGYLSSGIILKPYDWSVAFLVALLTKKGSGSALYRSLARLQGMIIGFVTGSVGRMLIYREMGMRGLVADAMAFALLAVMVFGAMFLYCHGTANTAFVGLLIAVVGSPQVVMRFVEGPYDYEGSQKATNGIVCVLFIMGIVNNAFGTRVSDKAPASLHNLWCELGELLNEIMNPNVEETRINHGNVKAMIDETRYLGAEATDEPRFWRIPWRAELFNKACDSCERIRLALKSLQVVGATNTIDAGFRSQVFLDILKKPSFQALLEVVVHQHEETKVMLEVFAFESKQPLKLDKPTMKLGSEDQDWAEKMTRCIDDMNHPQMLAEHSRLTRTRTLSSKALQFPQQQQQQHTSQGLLSLNDDVACQASRIILNLRAILDEIHHLQSEILINVH